MLRLLSIILPLLLKGPTKGPVKALIGRSIISALVFLAMSCLLAALFVWVMTTYSLVMAFLALAGIFLLGAVLIWAKQALSRSKRARRPVGATPTENTFAGLLPDALSDDPTVQKLLHEVGKNPIPAIGIALLTGTVLAREIFKKD